MERSARQTLDVVLASYIANRRGKSHDLIGLPSQVPDVPDDLRAVLWADCFDNFNMTLDYLITLHQNDVSDITQYPGQLSEDARNDLLSHTIHGKTVDTMDMHDVIAAITLLCTANIVLSSSTAAILKTYYPSTDERYEIRDKVTMGYMTELLVFLLSVSDGAVSKGLGEFRKFVRSLPEEVDSFAVTMKEDRIHVEESMKLRELGYVILGSLEDQHYGHINAHMESIRDSMQDSHLQAIRLRDFENGPTSPLTDAGECFDGLFTLWLWYNAKIEYIRDVVSSQ